MCVRVMRIRQPSGPAATDRFQATMIGYKDRLIIAEFGIIIQRSPNSTLAHLCDSPPTIAWLDRVDRSGGLPFSAGGGYTPPMK
jgi:hypothetical protein